MKIGIPVEIKPLEFRVGLIPEVVADLAKHGHQIYVQQGAGQGSGYSDAAYKSAGATVVATAEEVYRQAELVVKVKEPIEGDLQYLRRDHLLFCFLHLAALPELTEKLLGIGLTAIGFETVMVDGHLPLLAPMSEIAGKVAVQWGCQLLHKSKGGKGFLLGGVPGASRGQVTILGGGVAGYSAASLAAAIGAKVTVFDVNPQALSRVQEIGANVTGLYSSAHGFSKILPSTDLLVGAVLLPGAQAPKLVTTEMVKSMAPGSVIVDVAVDQGGCIETIRPTNYEQPTYLTHDVIHMAVTNMPGAVPRSASQALSGAIGPYVLALADNNLQRHSALEKGVNVADGKIVLSTLKP